MRRFSSLKFTLSLNFFLLSILPVAAIGISAILIVSNNIQREMKLKNADIAQSLSSEVETFLKEPLSLLKQVDDVLQSQAMPTTSAVNDYLSIVLENYHFFEMIQKADRSGKITNLAPYNSDYIDTDMSFQPFFTESIALQKTYFSPTFISMQSGNPTITLSIPSRGGGVLVGYVNLTYLASIIGNIGDQHKYAVITDQEGTIIADRSQERVNYRVNLRHWEPVLYGIQGVFDTFIIDENNEKLIISTASVPLTGWVILFVQHFDDAFAPVANIRQMLIFGVLLTMVIALVAAILRAKSINRSLSQLVDKAKYVADGHYTAPAIPHVFNELKDLDDSFNTMAESIKEREYILSVSERMHRRILEAIPYGVQETDLEGTITYANSAYEKIFDIEPGEAMGKKIWYFESNDERKEALKRYLSYLVVEKPEPTIYYSQSHTNKGKLIDIQVDWQYRLDSDGSHMGFISIITDITEKKALEESLRQSQKMEAIGTLSGGIAHDFNNILAAILGYSELVLIDLPEASDASRNQQQVIKACNRAKDLVQHLLLFSRKQQYELAPINLHVTIKEALKLLRATLPTTITFNLNIDQEVGNVRANPTQIHQIILNLCTNSAHAMENRNGILSVSYKRVSYTEIIDMPAEFMQVDYAMIRITDTGDGISAENLDRIFEPFFTTKDTGKGTGMGLAVVHGIVKTHEGHIAVTSKPQQGTTVYIYFPLTDDFEDIAKVQGSQIRGSGEHILIVDDEEGIVNFTSKALQRLGYRTTKKTDSTEALALFNKDPNLFDLVISDQTMPKLTGYELAQEIKKQRQDIPIILCTGYTASITESKAISAGISKFVQKPITTEALSEMVHQCLPGNTE